MTSNDNTFDSANRVDYHALEKSHSWYNCYGVNNYFSVCLSSEMSYSS